MININISYDFLSEDLQDDSLKIINKYYDWIAVDNCLDVSFIKFNQKPHVVISSNINEFLKKENFTLLSFFYQA